MSDDGFTAFLEEQLAGLGHIAVRRMFGGFGVFCDGLMFGLIFDDALYLKADDDTCAAFQAEDMEAITYESRGRTIALSYWRAPERLLDEPDEMLAWARTALAVARQAAAKKRKRSATGAARRVSSKRKPRGRSSR